MRDGHQGHGVHAGTSSRVPYLEWLAGLALIAVSLLTALLFLSWVFRTLAFDGSYLWSAARLTPLVSLFYGYDLYYGFGDGPILDTIYGPLAYLPFAPAALAATPTSVVLAGQAIAISMGLGAIGVLLVVESRRSKLSPYQTTCLGLNFFALLAFFAPSGAAAVSGFLAFMAFGIHADAPALAFATLACACVYGHKQTPKVWSLILSATFATLAVWAKQIEVGIFPAIGVYLWAAFGRAALTRFALTAALVGTGISLALVALFGFQSTLFNMFAVPSHHPLAVHGLGAIVAFVLGVGAATWILFVLAAGAVVLKLRSQDRAPVSGPEFRSSFAGRNPWVLLLLAAVFSVPTSILGSMKVGGLANSYHFAYYIAVLSALLFTSPGGRPSRRAVTRPAFILLLVFIPPLLPDLLWLKQADRIFDNSLEQAYRYARQNPGTAFFPWMPLSTLMAEGRLYHFDYGIFDWQLAGFAPATELFRRHIPARLTYVFYPATAPAPFPYRNSDPPAVQYLPECAYLDDGGPMRSFSENWRAWRCP